MAKTKTISLKGSAAKAFIQMARNEAPSEEDLLAQVATSIHMYVKTDQMAKAIEILKTVLKK
jgi:hypothetical protein